MGSLAGDPYWDFFRSHMLRHISKGEQVRDVI